VAFGAEKNLHILTRGGYSHSVKLNRSGKHFTPVMIRVVPAQLGTSGNRKNAQIPGLVRELFTRKTQYQPFN
jgi:hypothetical protein